MAPKTRARDELTPEKPTKRSRVAAAESDDKTFSPPGDFQDVKGLDAYRLAMKDADVFYVPDFVPTELANEWYEELTKLDTWYRPMLKMYGRTFPQSRSIAAYATSPDLKLKYSGQETTMNFPYPPVLGAIQRQVEDKLGVTFNHAMLNWYENGGVHIGCHRDNVENRVIASVSLGAVRNFVMQYAPIKAGAAKGGDGTDATEKKKWALANGSLVVMQGDTQRNWKHEIPKEARVKQGRISLTFRQLVYPAK